MATARLTERELEVLRLTDGSRTIREIAEELGMSERTAKMHSDNLRIKLGVKHRRELIAKRVAYVEVKS